MTFVQVGSFHFPLIDRGRSDDDQARLVRLDQVMGANGLEILDVLFQRNMLACGASLDTGIVCSEENDLGFQP